tara:strand:+ start:521 stop:1579 length:1059 start_codon:yes stop_codon:yes gene_type:complete
MKFFFIIIFFIFNQKITLAGSGHVDNREFYESRVTFIKEYIDQIKEKRKTNSRIKGTVVETLDGDMFTSIDDKLSQKELDEITLKECEDAEGIGCQIRFRTLKKNKKYNRYAKYDYGKKILFMLGDEIKSKKIYSVKGIDVLVNQKDYKSKNDFTCTKSKSNQKELLNTLIKEVNLYPKSFLNNSGLKYVMICEELKADNETIAGLAPSHYDQSPGVFFMNVGGLNQWGPSERINLIKHVFHHEFYHIIDTKLSKVYLDDNWTNLNSEAYSKDLVIDTYRMDTTVPGFISVYGRNNLAEDKAELFAFMISQHQNFKKKISNDKILIKKTKLMISRLKGISKDMNKNFWKNLN